MIKQVLPEILIKASLRREIDALSMKCASVEDAESVALARDISAPLHTNADWINFDSAVTTSILERGYVVVRGLNVDGGRSLLIVSTLLGGLIMGNEKDAAAPQAAAGASTLVVGWGPTGQRLFGDCRPISHS